jgi:hypothetical protein
MSRKHVEGLYADRPFPIQLADLVADPLVFKPGFRAFGTLFYNLSMDLLP